MQQEPARGVPQEGIQDSPPGTLGNSFLGTRRYPTDATSPPPPAPPPAPGPRRVFTRVVLPLLIFVVAIGTLAWVTQYLPSRGKGADAGAEIGDGAQAVASAKSVIQFPVLLAEWEPPVKAPDGKEIRSPYAAEFEVVSSDGRRSPGHYDFEFQNDPSGPAELGVKAMTCQCSSVKVALLDAAGWQAYQKYQASKDAITRAREDGPADIRWTDLKQSETEGVTVPAGGRGLVRLFWSGNKHEPERLRLTLTVWVQPQGKPEARAHTNLSAEAAYVKPVQFEPEELNVKVIPPRGSSHPADIVCWSSTRDIDVRVREPDPCFAFQVLAQDGAQCEALTREFRARGKPVRVKSAARIRVVVHEQKDGKQLDLGSFIHAVPVTVRANNEALPARQPTVRGAVLGDIQVGSLEDQNRIRLGNFSSSSGKSLTVRLRTRPGTALTYQGYTPPILKVDAKLRKAPGEEAKEWVPWELRVTVPPGVEPGPLPEESAILLLLRTGGTQRRVRIPLVGTAGRG